MMSTTMTSSDPTALRARPKKWRVILIDDHPVVRRGVREAIAAEEGIEVVGEAATVDDARSLSEREQPDLATVDISLGDENGLELIKQLRGDHPRMKILVLSVHDEHLYAERALRAGADGYVRKSESADRIMEAVRTVVSGGTALTPLMTERLVQQAVRHGGEEASGIESLSNRELEVFQLIGRGLSTRKIARRLCISIKTVETHRENIKHKLDIGDAAELTRHAVAWVEHPS